MNRPRFCLIAACLVAWIRPASALEPLRYNNPELSVDLGVGLWAWPLPCDADADGDFDLLASCHDKPSNGVWLFENPGHGSVDKFPRFTPGRRLSKTVQYVMPSYVEGAMRVLSPGWEYQGFERTGIDVKVALPVEANFHKPQGAQTKGPRLRHNQWRYVDYNGDGKLDLSVGVEDWSDYGWDDAWSADGEWLNGPLHGWIYIFLNRGSTSAPDYAAPFFVEADGKRLEVYGCPSPNFADFDGDDDLDLACGAFLDRFTYFENVGGRTTPRYAAGRPLKTPAGDELAMDLQMIVPVAFDWDRDGDSDLIVGDEDGRVALIENVGQGGEPDASAAPNSGSREPRFAEPRYFQQQADALKCGALATPVGVDWDADGDVDILSGNTAGYIEFFENLSGPRIDPPTWNRPVRLKANGETFRVMAGPNGSIQGPAEAKWGYTTFSVADWDADGLPDIVLNSILGRVAWLKNVGTRKAPKLAAAQPVEVEWAGAPRRLAWGWLTPRGNELQTQWRTTPVVYDIDEDGLADLAMLDHEGYLAFFRRERRGDRLLLTPPRRAFVDEQGRPLQFATGKGGKSGRRKLCIADWDGDGKFDVLLNSANADFWKQTEGSQGSWTFKNAGTLAERNIEGHDVSPTVVDFDGDGVVDFLGGAEDGRLYFLRNPRSAIVQSEFVYLEAPFPSCHASTIAEAADGTLVAAWFGGTHEKHPDVGIWVARRVDGAWTTPVEAANGMRHENPSADVERYPTWNPVLFQPQYADRGAPLTLFYKVGPSPDDWRGMQTTSADGGITWSPARRLPDGILGPIKNKPIQLADGSIVAPSSTESPDEKDLWQAHFERSEDGGKTWTKIGPVNDGVAIQAIQPSILSLGNDRLLAIGRTRQNKMFEVESHDGGRTWGAMKLGVLPNNNSGTDALTLADGRHLVVYNHVGGTPGEWGGKRTPLNVALSSDGRAWEAALTLESDPGEYSYPAAIQTSDGLVHVTYTWKRERIKHVTIDPTRLPNPPR